MSDFRNFSVSIDNIEKFTDVLSKGRCRIFYKYENRNGSFITDDFADSLLSTIAYTPVKGIYNNEAEDYEDHGQERGQGRIYGIVPENPNLAWEDHEDEDGVTRTYATVDVLLFTALYEEAGDIFGKSQSMEIYAPSIKGDWAYINGKRLFVYTAGSFLGLQVLGEDVEPCFEGAAFFSLDDVSQMKNFVDKLSEGLQKYELSLKGGQQPMENIFRLSHEAVDGKLFELLNPNFNEEGNWELSYAIWQVFDNYAVCGVIGTQDTVRIYYTVENDVVTLGETEPCFIVDVNEHEYQTLEVVRQLSNHSLDNIVETYGKIESMSTELLEKEEAIATLETEKQSANDEFTAQINGLNASLEEKDATIETLNGELEELHTFKKDVEKAQKMDVINEYAQVLSQEVLDEYVEKIDEFTKIELDKELAYELKQSKFDAFTHKDSSEGYVPKDEPATGIQALLDKYEKK